MRQLVDEDTRGRGIPSWEWARKTAHIAKVVVDGVTYEYRQWASFEYEYRVEHESTRARHAQHPNATREVGPWQWWRDVVFPGETLEAAIRRSVQESA